MATKDNLFVEIFGDRHTNVIKWYLNWNMGQGTREGKANYIVLKQAYNCYVPPTTGRQVQAALEATKGRNLVDYHRLIRVLCKFVEQKDTDKVTKMLESCPSDIEMYTYIKSVSERTYGVENPLDSRYMREVGTANLIKQMLIHNPRLKNRLKLRSILDLGCANGNKVVRVAQYLGLRANFTFGADIVDWYGMQKNQNKKFKFIKLVEGSPFPIGTRKHNLVLMQMTLHHVRNIEWYLKELNRVMELYGWLYVREHDAFTHLDYLLTDIEHMLYGYVKEEKQSPDKYYARYFDWMELGTLLEHYGFRYWWRSSATDSVMGAWSCTRHSEALFYKFKNVQSFI